MDASELFVIKSNTTEPVEGQILLAEPMLNSLHFGRSAILLIEHNSTEGSFGIVVNKPIRTTINQLVEDFPYFDVPVFIGGPVEEDRLFFLHTFEEVPDSIEIMDGLYWGGDLEAIKSQITIGRANGSNLRFFLGYSGWEPGQLKKELEENSWAVVDANATQILKTPHHKLWQNLSKQLGGIYRYWYMYPKDPKMN